MSGSIEILRNTNHYICSYFLEPYKCKNCAFKSHDTRETGTHVCAKRDVNPKFQPWFGCHLCAFKSYRKDDYRRHLVQSHEKNDYFHCMHCGYRVKHLHKFEMHIENKHIGDDTFKGYHCDKCNFQTMLREHLTNHVKQTHAKPKEFKYECDFCSFCSPTIVQLHEHNIVFHNDQLRRCDQCDFKTRYNGDLQKHVEKKHSNRIGGRRFLACDQCDYKTRHKQALTNHIAKKHMNVDTVFRCKHCNYITMNLTYFKKHIKTKHTLADKVKLQYTFDDRVKWYQCGQCCFKSKSHVNIKKHISLTHSTGLKQSDTQFKCSECSFATHTLINLQRHEHRIHKTDDILCDICGLKSRDMISFKEHCGRVHSDKDKIWKCDMCTYKSFVKSNFIRHVRNSHTPNDLIPWHFCHKCSFKTKQLSYLKTHFKSKKCSTADQQ